MSVRTIREQDVVERADREAFLISLGRARAAFEAMTADKAIASIACAEHGADIGAPCFRSPIAPICTPRLIAAAKAEASDDR